eukprot:c17931_g1_i6.p1 GENE.c17931_g1_i6~~c17931_g1_i6.p1  ORF type:complete len:430 (+),score=95.72 c17931_g1_i6:1148-2437(+)
MQLQSQVRQLDARRLTQRHISKRLNDYMKHLKTLRRAPELYSKCLSEVVARQRYARELSSVVEICVRQQAILYEAECARVRDKFEAEIPSELAARIFAGLSHPPFRYDLSPVPELFQNINLESVAETTPLSPGIRVPSEASHTDSTSAEVNNLRDELTKALAASAQAQRTIDAVKSEKDEIERRKAEMVQRFDKLLTEASARKQSFQESEQQYQERLSAQEQEKAILLTELAELRANVKTLEQTVGSFQNANEFQKSQLAKHHELTEAAHGFIGQLNEFAQELKIATPPVVPREAVPKFDDAIQIVRTLFYLAQEYTKTQHQLFQHANSAPPISFKGANSTENSVVIFQRLPSNDQTFVTIASGNSLGILSDDSKMQIMQHLSSQSRYVVGRVVMRAELTPEQGSIGLGRGPHAALTVEVLQIDDEVCS